MLRNSISSVLLLSVMQLKYPRRTYGFGVLVKLSTHCLADGHFLSPYFDCLQTLTVHSPVLSLNNVTAELSESIIQIACVQEIVWKMLVLHVILNYVATWRSAGFWKFVSLNCLGFTDKLRSPLRTSMFTSCTYEASYNEIAQHNIQLLRPRRTDRDASIFYNIPHKTY